MTEEDKAQIHSLIVSRMDRLEDKLDQLSVDVNDYKTKDNDRHWKITIILIAIAGASGNISNIVGLLNGL
jgi:hypothetical protein